MLNYIKAELYKFLHRPYMYVTLGCVIAFMVSFFVLASNVLPNNPREWIIEIATIDMKFIWIAMIIFTVTFCEEFKNKTLKNIMSYGLSREKIFISKLIVESIQAIIIAGISMFIFVTYVYYFTEPCSKYSLLVFIVKFLAAIPLCLGALAFINIFILLIKNELVMSFSYIAIMIGLPAITLLLHNFIWDKFHYLGYILLTTQINKLLYMQTINGDMLKIALVGVIYIFVFTAIGLGIFKKKEIV